MNSIINLIKFFVGISLLLFLIFFPPLLIVALLVVPATYIYAKANGQSYNFTIDQSETLYKLNNLGIWAWILGGGFLLIFLLLASSV
jgi:hypothetical protein